MPGVPTRSASANANANASAPASGSASPSQQSVSDSERRAVAAPALLGGGDEGGELREPTRGGVAGLQSIAEADYGASSSEPSPALAAGGEMLPVFLYLFCVV